MSIYYEQIRTAIDPEQAGVCADGELVQDVSVIMTSSPKEERPPGLWLDAAIVTLDPAQARELAFELLGAAETADRIGGHL